MVDLLRLENQRDVKLRSQSIPRARSHYSDHCVRFTIHLDGLPDDVAIAAQVLPEFVAEDDFVLLAGFTFFRKKVAPHGKFLSHHALEADGARRAVNLLRLIGSREIEVRSAPCTDLLKGFVLPFPVEIIARGYTIVAALNLRPDHHKLVRLRIWHRRQQHGVNHAENGRVRADAQRKCDRSHGGEAGIFPEKAETIANILP